VKIIKLHSIESFLILTVISLSIISQTYLNQAGYKYYNNTEILVSQENPIGLELLLSVPKYYDIGSKIGFAIASIRTDKNEFVPIDNINVELFPSGRPDIILATLRINDMLKFDDDKILYGYFSPIIIPGQYTIRAIYNYTNPYLEYSILVSTEQSFSVGKWFNLTKYAQEWFDDLRENAYNSIQQLGVFRDNDDDMITALVVYTRVQRLFKSLIRVASIPPCFNMTVIKIDGYKSDINMTTAESVINSSLAFLNSSGFSYSIRYIRDINSLMDFFNFSSPKKAGFLNIIVNLHGSYLPVKDGVDYSKYIERIRNGSIFNKWTWLNVGTDMPFKYLYTSANKTIELNSRVFAGFLYAMGLLDGYDVFPLSERKYNIYNGSFEGYIYDPLYTDSGLINVTDLTIPWYLNEKYNIISRENIKGWIDNGYNRADYWCTLGGSAYRMNPNVSVANVETVPDTHWETENLTSDIMCSDSNMYKYSYVKIDWYVDSKNTNITTWNDTYIDVYMRASDNLSEIGGLDWTKIGTICTKAELLSAKDYYLKRTNLNISKDYFDYFIDKYLPMSSILKVPQSIVGKYYQLRFNYHTLYVRYNSSIPYTYKTAYDPPLGASGLEVLLAWDVLLKTNYICPSISTITTMFWQKIFDYPENYTKINYFRSEPDIYYKNPFLAQKNSYLPFTENIQSSINLSNVFVLGPSTSGYSLFMSDASESIFNIQYSSSNGFIYSALPINYTMNLTYGGIWDIIVDTAHDVKNNLESLYWELPSSYEDFRNRSKSLSDQLEEGITEKNMSYIRQTFALTTNLTNDLISEFKDPIANLVNYNLRININLSEYLVPLLDSMREINSSVSSFLSVDAVNEMKNYLDGLNITGSLIKIYSNLGASISNIFYALDPYGAAWDLLGKYVNPYLSIPAYLDPMYYLILTLQQLTIDGFESMGAYFGEYLNNLLGNIINIVGGMINNILAAVNNAFNMFMDTVITTLGDVISKMQELINEAVDTIAQQLHSVAIQIHDTIISIVDYMLSMKQEILEYVDQAIYTIQRFFISTFDDIYANIQSLYDDLYTAYDGLQKAIAFVPEIANSLLQTIEDAYQKVGWLQYIMNWTGLNKLLPDHFELETEIAYTLSITRQAESGIYLLLIDPDIAKNQMIYFVCLDRGFLHDLSSLTVDFTNNHSYSFGLSDTTRVGQGVYKLDLSKYDIVPENYTMSVKFRGSDESAMVERVEVLPVSVPQYGGLYLQISVDKPSLLYTESNNKIVIHVTNKMFRESNVKVYAKLYGVAGNFLTQVYTVGFIPAESKADFTLYLRPPWYSVFAIGKCKLIIRVVELDSYNRETNSYWDAEYISNVSWGLSNYALFSLFSIPYLYTIINFYNWAKVKFFKESKKAEFRERKRS